MMGNSSAKPALTMASALGSSSPSRLRFGCRRRWWWWWHPPVRAGSRAPEKLRDSMMLGFFLQATVEPLEKLLAPFVATL
jgi:hypothetical protein